MQRILVCNIKYNRQQTGRTIYANIIINNNLGLFLCRKLYNDCCDRSPETQFNLVRLARDGSIRKYISLNFTIYKGNARQNLRKNYASYTLHQQTGEMSP